MNWIVFFIVLLIFDGGLFWALFWGWVFHNLNKDD